jgi:N-acetylglutamate synthase-like GNAT family acetyltransferase
MAYKMLKIRPAINNDLEKCEAMLHIATMRCATGEYYDKSFLREYLDKDFFLVAENDGKIAGCIFGETVKGGGAIVWAIVVHEKYRGTGIGSKLLKVFEKNCKNTGVQWIILYAPQKKEKTHKFYRKHKFNKGAACIEFVKTI